MKPMFPGTGPPIIIGLTGKGGAPIISGIMLPSVPFPFVLGVRSSDSKTWIGNPPLDTTGCCGCLASLEDGS